MGSWLSGLDFWGLGSFSDVNWLEMLIPAVISCFVSLFAYSWKLAANSRKKELNNILGSYYGYYINPSKPSEVISIDINIYRSFLSRSVKTTITYPGSSVIHKGYLENRNGIIYFYAISEDEQYKDHLIFKNPVNSEAKVLVGVWASVTHHPIPCCGMQILSREKLTDQTVRQLACNQNSLIVTYNDTYEQLSRNITPSKSTV
ncbi:hypothetical protein [Photobacterium alginatilyticum]|uniref:Uncharacterized protein n=1 Tax=Photobacterium alginatilyticum TaxID=1775171 RepID=A0ABW9YEA2_9GAMM|nr:hypothetical protein [Photobacterium alginatilyticum]NBI51760.1 hypothetical protein [Photobacterium alginatilyticum]